MEEQAQLQAEVAAKKRAKQTPSSFNLPIGLEKRYQVLQSIGHGAQGEVFEATRIEDGVQVAIKTLRIDSIQNWKCYDLFKREAEVLSSLNLAGVAKFYEAGEDLDSAKPCAWIVQEHINGQTLDKMLKAGYRFSLPMTFKIAGQILSILESLHKHEPVIIHRDIKPSNIMLKQTDRGEFEVYLVDFGAVANPQVKSGGSTMAGTYGYMPPEQLMGTPCPASDVYALGATIVYMLCGVETGEMRVADHRPVIDPYLQMVPRGVVITLNQMLDPNLENRLWEHPSLKKLFLNFENNNYGHSASNVSTEPLSREQYNERLKNITSYGQSGNFDLWMQLSENTPRKIPACYSSFQPKEYIGNFGGQIPNWKQVVVFFIVANLFVILLREVGAILLFIILSVYLPIKYFGLGNYKLLHFWLEVIKIGTSKFLPNQDKDYQKLLRYGRKGVAVVVDFTYIPTVPTYAASEKAVVRFVPSEEGAKNFSSSLYMIKKKSSFLFGQDHTPELIPFCSATFRLRYKFNPPDDSVESDLVHEVILHNDYSDVLTPGTPLPILYAFKKYNSNSLVLSMPFPLVLSSIESISEITCCTRDGAIVHEEF